MKSPEQIKKQIEFWFFKYHEKLKEEFNGKEMFTLYKLLNNSLKSEIEEKLNPSSPYDKGKNGWENNSIPDFLDSIIAFGEDSDSINQKASWKDFALLLFAGKFYE